VMTRTAWGWIPTCRACGREVDAEETYCSECSVETDGTPPADE